MAEDEKVCLITGATSGIGRAAAASIAAHGFRMVLVGRDEQRGADAVDEVRARSGNRDVAFLRADLSLTSEVRGLARRFRSRHDRLDLLVNNAGAIFLERAVTPEGFELTLALNHLAYFTLSTELLDLLRASAPARVVSVSSSGHRVGHIDFDDMTLERRYNGLGAYGRSKLANILFTRELARRLEGTGVTANCMHPGYVGTGFATNNGPLTRFVMSLGRLVARTPEQGADTLVYLATSPEVQSVSGEYFHDRRPARVSREARDAEVARRLWAWSEAAVERLRAAA